MPVASRSWIEAETAALDAKRDEAVEAQAGNGDIGFVREGQEVAVKLEAFPFTRYGLLKGHVRKLGRDAVQTGQVAATGRRLRRSRAPPASLLRPARRS